MRVICVDDEPDVLNGLMLHLRRKYEVDVATSGLDALTKLAGMGDPPAVVISDMRMPGMNGAELLSKVRERYPDTTRILLTGHADVPSAAAAINEGQVFRFLTKPCAPPVLLGAVDAGVEMHRLVTSERVLLEQTLHGCVHMLVDILAITSPASFGRANRIKKYVTELASRLRIRDRWQVEVAAMLSQIGTIILPPETIDKLHCGSALTPDEQKMAARTAATAEQLLARIPRLEEVRYLLAEASRTSGSSATMNAPKHQLEQSVQALRIAMDFDLLEGTGQSPDVALSTMAGRPERYDPEVLKVFVELRGELEPRQAIRQISAAALRVGMVLAEDMRMTSGTLLVARGYEITASFLKKVANFRPGTLHEPIKVWIKSAPTN
ncbi:MAG TPA: HD domain-containing phosphohydrolase [Polyangiaceae bacterium]|jgi:response regulator RpfG family c-di-GMP phosphodiesterase|nr:HD domain-containing phosphohydrolase [Polyangiaceae bacterium]